MERRHEGVNFQSFELVFKHVVLLLHRLFLEGLAPEQMTYFGRNVDVLAALLALPTASLVTRRGEHDPLARRVALAMFAVTPSGTTHCWMAALIAPS